jgi:N-acetylmuramoyl-L-alanine amidase
MSPEEVQEKRSLSRKLAASVQKALFGTLAAKNPTIRNRGVKEASFVVLKGTTMPSILAEVSFVSSPTDEANLRNAEYRQQIAEALYKGIARYAAASHRASMASATPGK